jgi:hypothetical protein
MATNKLTAKKIQNAREPGVLNDGANLNLQVTKGANGSLSKSWIFRFFSPVAKRERHMGLGPFPLVSLEQARTWRIKPA